MSKSKRSTELPSIKIPVGLDSQWDMWLKIQKLESQLRLVTHERDMYEKLYGVHKKLNEDKLPF